MMHFSELDEKKNEWTLNINIKILEYDGLVYSSDYSIYYVCGVD